jgi:hypothetical protein
VSDVYAGIEQRAKTLSVFADRLEEAGMAVYARRARDVARDTLQLLGELETERSARRQVQARAERLLSILARRDEQEELLA